MAPRRNLDETRELLLDAGAELLRQRGIAPTFDRITMIDVCRRAGLKTAGSAYKIWDSQDAFRFDLLDHLLVDSSSAQATIAHVEALGAIGPDAVAFDELIRIAAAVTDELMGETYPTYLVVWLARLTDPGLARSAEHAEADWLGALTVFVNWIMDAYDLEFVPPFDAPSLVVAVSALLEGLTIRRRTTPEIVPDSVDLPTGPEGTDRPWGAFAIGAQTLFASWTRPRTVPGDPVE